MNATDPAERVAAPTAEATSEREERRERARSIAMDVCGVLEPIYKYLRCRVHEREEGMIAYRARRVAVFAAALLLLLVPTAHAEKGCHFLEGVDYFGGDLPHPMSGSVTQVNL